jgi:MbtH protein
MNDDRAASRVVLNRKERRSIWPEGRPISADWRDAGKLGSRADCLAYIENSSGDMSPLNLRITLESAEGTK